MMPSDVKIVEVGPRDGLQNEKKILSADQKIVFIDQLSATGLSTIEVTSFVSPKWIPQLADSGKVFQDIQKKPGVQYPVLIPNVKGLENALAVGVKEIAVFTTPSETFSLKNTNCSVQESLNRIAEVIQMAKQAQLSIRGYLSCVLGCPYEGEIAPQAVVALASKLLAMGCDEISLGDTIGIGTPLKTQRLIKMVADQVPLEKVAVHFHDTYGQALANIFAALECGVAIVDSAVAGLGGCPYAKGAAGNVATEDVLFMLQGMGIKTGVDLQKVIQVSQFITKELGVDSPSKVYQAMKSSYQGR